MLKYEGCSDETHSLNETLKGCEFQSDEDVKAVVVQWFQQQPREFFAEGINQQMPQRLSDCGDCFERHLLLCPEQSLKMFHLNFLHTYQYVQRNFTQAYI
jgi:hypothetical protein